MANAQHVIKVQLDPTALDKIHTVYRAALNDIAADRADLTTLIRWMADNDWPADEIAYAVEKPWKFTGELGKAKAALEAEAQR